MTQVFESQYAPVRSLQTENEQFQTELKELSSSDSLVGRLQESRPPFLAIAFVSRSTGECDGRVWVQKFVLQQNQESQKSKEKQETAPSTKPSGMLTLHGIALDNLDVSKFVVALRSTNAFDRVELKSSIGVESRDKALRSYVVECSF